MNNLPNGWQVKSLGEVVKISKGKKLKSLVDNKTEKSIRFIQIDDLRNNESLKYTEDKSGVLVNDKDVLIAWDGANAGTVGFGLDGFIGSTIARLEILNESVSTNYFGWYLRTKSKYLRDNSTGATIPHINKSVLESLKIPLPPLPIQKQIAEILEKADEAKQKRKVANKLTDEFLQSVFIEMFGDPLKNSKRWEVKKLDELCSVIRDGVHKTPNYINSGIPFLTVLNISQGKLDFSKTKFISISEHKELTKRVKPEYGDILVSKDGSIGIPCYINTNKEFSIFVSVALLRPKKEIVNSIFLTEQIRNGGFQKQILDRIKGIAIRHLHLEDFRQLNVMLPPLSLQQQFAEIVNKTEALKEKQKKSEQELENLFQSLMQRAFKGELDLTEVRT